MVLGFRVVNPKQQNQKVANSTGGRRRAKRLGQPALFPRKVGVSYPISLVQHPKGTIGYPLVIYKQINKHIGIYIYIHTYTHTYIYIYTYRYIHIHIHI